MGERPDCQAGAHHRVDRLFGAGAVAQLDLGNHQRGCGRCGAIGADVDVVRAGHASVEAEACIRANRIIRTEPLAIRSIDDQRRVGGTLGINVQCQ